MSLGRLVVRLVELILAALLGVALGYAIDAYLHPHRSPFDIYGPGPGRSFGSPHKGVTP